MLERQREGVAKAKAEGKYQGTGADGAAEGCRSHQAEGQRGEARRDRGEARDQSGVGVPGAESPTEPGQLTTTGAVRWRRGT